MNTRITLSCTVVAVGFAAIVASGPAQALTTQECSAKYQAAKAAGTLNGQKWSDFRKAQCGADATPAATAAPAAAAKDAAKNTVKDTKKEAAAPAASGNAVFPAAVDPKYAKETSAKARLHTCADQYKANKAANANGGLPWIKKGGGYWSECNTKLKG